MSMKQMTLKNIAEVVRGTLHNCQENLEVTGVVTDSRQVKQGYLFLAVKGERVDGHRFINQVIENGAAAVICTDAPQEEVPYILVEDVLKALCDMAEFYRSMLEIPIIGITGSVGKTSTKECIASVLCQKYNVFKTEGNFNNEIGVPLMILRIREHHQVAVLEMGINHFGEMHRLSKMVKPDIVVMTNIGQCHLEFLGSRDGILKAKSEIFDYLQEQGTVIINGDDDKLSTIKDVRGIKPITFGRNATNMLYADQINNKGLFGTQMHIYMNMSADLVQEKAETVSFQTQIPLPGEHMVYNALAATAVGHVLGLNTNEISRGISEVQATGGRSNIIQTADHVIIDDCYNANPVSMCAAIDLLTLADTRKVAILGDMFELGEQAEKMHGEVGRYAAEKAIDVILCIGKLSVTMAEEARLTLEESHKNGKDIQILHYATKELLYRDWESVLQKNDTILVKASHGMGFAEIVEKLK